MRYSILYPIQRSGVRFARMGTSVTPTQAAMASAASAVVLASVRWPSSAAAPEYSARSSAAVSAVMERKNARTAGRSALAQSRAMVDFTALILVAIEGRNRFLPIRLGTRAACRALVAALRMTMLFVFVQALMKGRLVTRTRSQGNGNGFHDIAKDRIGGFRFFLQRGVARTGDDAVRENGNGKLLEIIGEAIIAAIEESAGLRGALEHESAAGADTESKLFALARAINDLESVIVQAGVDLDVGHGVLHGKNIADIRDRIERIKRIIANAFAQNFFFRFVRGVTHFDAHQETVEL